MSELLNVINHQLDSARKPRALAHCAQALRTVIARTGGMKNGNESMLVQTKSDQFVLSSGTLVSIATKVCRIMSA